ncbi:NAD-dependent epimerase/dehydratase family protein [Streptomyces bohaiensis]|uniref:NAD-dependent epimerase/dehydratase family protein n=1 Tax=Streptomyces bohaiensis TaxID=1431344 RepID=UPI003B7EECCE
MRVLVAGATGVIGRQLMPLLATHGLQGIALARTARRATEAERTGARVVIADALDAQAVDAAVGAAEPDVIVNMLTAIPAAINPRRMASQFEATDRLRTEGTAHLLAAARRHGVRHAIAQSVAFAYDPDAGLRPAVEDDPLWRSPAPQFAPALAAIRGLEEQVVAANGLVMRFGHLYGPGTAFGAGGSITRAVRRRRMPVIGGGTATFSFLHTHDAATAILAALDRPAAAGIVNVVDDDPARVSDWLPYLAELVEARPPFRLPAALARMLVGSWGVQFQTRLRGADNTRAATTLGWRPRHSSWREGLAHDLTGAHLDHPVD